MASVKSMTPRKSSRIGRALLRIASGKARCGRKITAPYQIDP